MKRLVSTAIAAVALGTSGPVAAEDMKIEWKDGLRFATTDGASEYRVGVRLQSDWVFQDRGDDLPTPEDGTEFRRLYLEFDAVIEQSTEVRAHVDVSGGEVALRDAWVGLRKLPAFGTVRVGHQYEPMGFDEQTSDRYLMFAERALPMALVPSRNTGVLATNSMGPATWAAMISRDADDAGDGAGSGQYNVTGRLAVVPWREAEGRRMIHLGISASQRNPERDAVSYSQRPENHLAPRLVNTGTIAADGATVLGFEGATVLGPCSAQTEWVRASVASLDNTDPAFSGWYAAVSCFLTGETRPYSRSSATFSRVKPKRSFTKDGGTGAWELAARFSRLDLTDRDAGVNGGELQDVTVGLNWHINPYVRTVLNWVHADLEDAGTSDAAILRFEGNF